MTSGRRPDPAALSGSTLSELGLPEDLVTGEAVVLDLHPASFASRSLAILLDLFVLFLLAIGLGFAAGQLDYLDAAAGAAATLTMFVTVFLVIPVAVETLTRGRSLGKFAAGLRVVRDDGGPVRFRQALVRGLLAVLETYLLWGGGAILASLANPRGKRIGDLLAGTYVIRERTGRRELPAAEMPPELAGWARTADLGRVPDQLALAARAYLARLATLHPASRQRLGITLAGALARHVAPHPSPGTSPERFIAAVLAERRRRDLARLQAETAARRARDARRGQADVLSPLSTRLVGGHDPAAGSGR